MKIKRYILSICYLYAFNLVAQDFDLLTQLNGKYDFTMIGNTLNLEENSNSSPCVIQTSSQATLSLNSLDVVEKAYLFWAGSGPGDLEVNLNNNLIIAQNNFTIISRNLPYFSAVSDVTDIVSNTGNGEYTLSNLDLTNVIGSYCNNATNFGGWAIIVVYSNPNLIETQINIYNDLDYVSRENPSIEFQINNLFVSNNENSKIAFLAWEGDSSLAVEETLKVNGVLIEDLPLNPITNVFNSTNSFTNESNLYNMDLDFFEIDDLISIGDTNATIELTSGQDFVMINTVVTKLNSELPDAIISNFETELINCNEREIQLNFDLKNVYDLGTLPSELPIAIYIENELQLVVYSTQELDFNEIESFEVILNVLEIYPLDIEIKVVADDLGTGFGEVLEFDEFNNSETKSFQFDYCFPIIPQGFSPNDDTINDLFIPINLYDEFKDFEMKIYNRYGNLIYKGFNNDEPWNGTYKSKNLPEGTYYYVIELNDEKYNRIVGWVYLNR